MKLENNFTCVLSKSIRGDPVGSGKTAEKVLLASYRTQNYFLCPVTDKYSNKSWNWFVKNSIPWALPPVLENFRLRFSWPNWPPLSFRGIFLYDFPGFNCNLLNKCKIKQYVDLMQKKYITYWNHTLQHSQKLNFYYKIKTNYSPSVYLDLTRKNPSRKTLVKLRISSHKLRIETGRYDNIRRDEKLRKVMQSLQL